MADYKYTPADFKSDQEVRWCPGCGDHAILSAVQRALPEIADAPEELIRAAMDKTGRAKHYLAEILREKPHRLSAETEKVLAARWAGPGKQQIEQFLHPISTTFCPLYTQ